MFNCFKRFLETLEKELLLLNLYRPVKVINFNFGVWPPPIHCEVFDIQKELANITPTMQQTIWCDDTKNPRIMSKDIQATHYSILHWAMFMRPPSGKGWTRKVCMEGKGGGRYYSPKRTLLPMWISQKPTARIERFGLNETCRKNQALHSEIWTTPSWEACRW